MGKVLKIILGAALVILGLGLVYLFRFDVLTLIQGSLGLFLILAGLICFAIASE